MPEDQKELFFSDDISENHREQILMDAEVFKSQKLAQMKQLQLEKQLAKMDKTGDNMNANDVIAMMNDDNMIERYSMHLNKIFFKY